MAEIEATAEQQKAWDAYAKKWNIDPTNQKPAPKPAPTPPAQDMTKQKSFIDLLRNRHESMK